MHIGVGDTALPACSTLTMPAGFVGPVNCDPTNGPVTYTPAGGTCDQGLMAQGFACTETANGPDYIPLNAIPAGSGGTGATASTTLVPGLSNSALILAAAGFVAVMVLSKR